MSHRPRPARPLASTPVLRLTLCLALGGCDRGKAPEPEPSRAPPSPAASGVDPKADASPPTKPFVGRPAPERLVAIGDIHGDLERARRVLRLAGAIDAHDAWVGGKLVVVQTGDEIDRGDDDRKVLDLFEKLKVEAKKAGGEVIAMLGNHEVMNAVLDFRYVTPGGFAGFSDVAPKNIGALGSMPLLPNEQRGREVAFVPGGPYATVLADRPVIVKVGTTVFAHGGILPKYAAYGADRINAETRAWLLGTAPHAPAAVIAEDGPVWTRAYAAESAPCPLLSQALGALGASRMVMGHTVQQGGITDACEHHEWLIDVGLSHYYKGPIEAIEIKGDAVTKLKEPS